MKLTAKVQMPTGSTRPPLRALAAFEAAARLGSFNVAAKELHLTPSAISHQILALEGLLGIELFARVGRGVELTMLGTRYFENIQHILSALDEATREIVNFGASEVVTIHTPPSLASKWLLPLLPTFMRANPHIEVRVSAETGRAGFSWNTFDLAILYRQAHAIEDNAAPFLEELIQPMCSPNILHDQPIKSPLDILQHVLIHTNYNAVTWKDWFIAQSVPGYGQHRRVQIDPSHVAIEAAAKEFGIVLESDVLAKGEISSGRLVTPLSDYAISRSSYVLTWSPDKALRESAALFRDWLLATVGRNNDELLSSIK